MKSKLAHHFPRFMTEYFSIQDTIQNVTNANSSVIVTFVLKNYEFPVKCIIVHVIFVIFPSRQFINVEYVCFLNLETRKVIREVQAPLRSSGRVSVLYIDFLQISVFYPDLM